MGNSQFHQRQGLFWFTGHNIGMSGKAKYLHYYGECSERKNTVRVPCKGKNKAFLRTLTFHRERFPQSKQFEGLLHSWDYYIITGDSKHTQGVQKTSTLFLLHSTSSA